MSTLWMLLWRHCCHRRPYRISYSLFELRISSKSMRFLCKLGTNLCTAEPRLQMRSKVKSRWTKRYSSRFHFISLGEICSNTGPLYRIWYFLFERTKSCINRSRHRCQWLKILHFHRQAQLKANSRMELKDDLCTILLHFQRFYR